MKNRFLLFLCLLTCLACFPKRENANRGSNPLYDLEMNLLSKSKKKFVRNEKKYESANSGKPKVFAYEPTKIIHGSLGKMEFSLENSTDLVLSHEKFPEFGKGNAIYDTQLLNSALEFTAARGATVVVPPNRRDAAGKIISYKLNATLKVKNTSFIGQVHGNFRADDPRIPRFEWGGVDEPNIAWIELSHGGTVSGINLEGQNSQKPTGIVIHPNPSGGNNNGYEIKDLSIRFFNEGIVSENVEFGRINIENVYLLHMKHIGISLGLRKSKIVDYSTLSKVYVRNFSPDFHGTGIRLGRIDGINISDCNVFGVGVGIDLVEDELAGGSSTSISNFMADHVLTGIIIRGNNHLNISNGEIWAHDIGLQIGDEHITQKKPSVLVSSTRFKANNVSVLVKQAQSVSITGSKFRLDNSSAPKIPIVIKAPVFGVFTGNIFALSELAFKRKHLVEYASSVNKIFIEDGESIFFESDRDLIGRIIVAKNILSTK